MHPTAFLLGVRLSVVATLLLAGCAAGSRPFGTLDKDGPWSIVQPYHYPLSGIGGGQVIGSIPVPETKEATVASKSLLIALQENQLAIQKPDVPLDGVIPSNTKWITDIAPIPTELVAA